MLRIIILLVAAVSITGCAEKDDPITNSNGGNCGIGVVGDYNSMVRNCRSSSSSACDSTIKSFLNKYPGINCNATRDIPNSVDEKVVTIKESDIRQLLSTSPSPISATSSTQNAATPPTPSSATPPKEATAIIYKLGARCSGVVIDDYNSTVPLSCSEASTLTSLNTEVYENCRDGIASFLESYPGVYCRHAGGDSHNKYLKESTLKDIQRTMNEVIEMFESMDQQEESESEKQLDIDKRNQ